MNHPVMQEAVTAQRIREQLLERYPELVEDEQALMDTLEGETDINEMIVEIVESALVDNGNALAAINRAKEIDERANRIQLRAHKKKEIAQHAMELAGLKKIEAPSMTLSVANRAPKVIITDEEKLPADFLNVVKSVKPDRKAIGEALKSGTAIPGAELSNPQPTLTVRTK